MKFTKLALKGAYLIEIEPKVDERGFFARAYCTQEFEAHGIPSTLKQCNISYSHTKGTLRGMHYQEKPHSEAKLVRCTGGALYDVLIDLRKESPTYAQWVSLELSAQNRSMVFIPEGLAHGFQTLEDNTEVFYQMSTIYTPGYAKGILWNDPYFNIPWPIQPPTILSQADRSYLPFIC